MQLLKSIVYYSLFFWGTIFLVGLGYPLVLLMGGILLVAIVWLGPVILLIYLICKLFNIPIEDIVDEWIISIKFWFQNLKKRTKEKLNSLKKEN